MDYAKIVALHKPWQAFMVKYISRTFARIDNM